MPENVSQKTNAVCSFLSNNSQSLDHAVSQGDPRMKILQEKWVGFLEVPKLIVNVLKEDIVLSDFLTSVKLTHPVS